MITQFPFDLFLQWISLEELFFMLYAHLFFKSDTRMNGPESEPLSQKCQEHYLFLPMPKVFNDKKEEYGHLKSGLLIIGKVLKTSGIGL